MKKILFAVLAIAFVSFHPFVAPKAHQVSNDRAHNIQHLKEGLQEREGQIFCMSYETWKNEFVEPKGLVLLFMENLEEHENDPVVRARAFFVSANRKEVFAVILTKTNDVCLVFSMLNAQEAR